MKISYNWLRQYLHTDFSAEKIGEILTAIGLELEGITPFESAKGGLKGLVVGHVLASEQHPNADRLAVTKVDIGADNALQIVCGAPNVAAGQKVVVATVGTLLYPTEGEPFEIKKSKIRGIESNGMICAEDEIGIGHSHDGIMVLPPDVAVGTAAADFFGIESDWVFEIGLTPNRSDATSHLGVARDLAATLRINYGLEGKVQVPSVAAFPLPQADLPIRVRVENTTACPRYSGVVIDGVKVGESPEWLKNRLRAVGVRPINNVVDVTNFVLHELGQPLHAFDYHKIVAQEVVVKNLEAGTPFVTLDGNTRRLHADDLMICHGGGEGMCIGGVFGGLHSGISEATTTIFLESAFFDPISIRRTGTRHLLRTDAARTFEKGVNPNGTVYALQRAALLLLELAGGHLASPVIDLYPQPIAPRKVAVRYSRVAALIGNALAPELIQRIVLALGMDLVDETPESLTVAVPTDKFDVTREADVIEEILRIYGLNRVTIPLHIKSALTHTPQPDEFTLRNNIANMLSARGFYEMMALSITQSKYTQEVLSIGEAELIFINNTSNQHLNIMRPTMLFGGLEAIARNANRQHTHDLRFYEFGRIYRQPQAGQYSEQKRLALFVAGENRPESWHYKGTQTVNYYDLKAQVEGILARLGLAQYQTTALPTDHAAFAYGVQLHRGNQVFAELGRLHTRIGKAMDIKLEVFFADIDWDAVCKAIRNQQLITKEIPRFPSVRRDLALVLDVKVNFGEVAAIARKQAKKLLQDINLFDVYENAAQLGEGKKSYAVSFIFQDDTKTLQDKELDVVMEKLITTYEKQLGAIIRR